MTKMLWTIIGISEKTDSRNNTYYKCKCVCGVVKEVRASSYSKDSFGCKKCRNALRTHGESESRLHNIWSQMHNRCKNISQDASGNYAKRGISVCENWRSYENFKNWSLKNGYAENLTIDRINNDLGYCPENCRWVTPAQQNRNQRTNIRVKIGNSDLILKDWCKILGLKYDSVRWDIKKGLTPEEAFRKRILK